MLDPFDQKKASILKEISQNSEDNKDLSPKGTIDEKCIPLINLINSHQDLVTTSSCSGRVSVFVEGIKDKQQIGAKGHEGRWLFITHDTADLDGWYEKVDFDYDFQFDELDARTRYVLFKFEPLILHVKCRDMEAASQLYKVAMNNGFRESGIGVNHVVAIRISIKLDIPIGFYTNDKIKFNVNEGYLKFITRLSRDRFEENFRKITQLYEAIGSMSTAEPAQKETKEERRARKIQEGLARRDGVRQLKQQQKLLKQKALDESKANVQVGEPS